jgi:DNA-binding response OmpR family regulator
MNNTAVRRIVCIEDEPEMIELIQLILNRRGFEVLGAPGGKKVSKWCVRYCPTLCCLI